MAIGSRKSAGVRQIGPSRPPVAPPAGQRRGSKGGDRASGAPEAADRLDRRQLLVEFGPDGVDVLALDVELTSDLVHNRRLLGRDGPVDRLDREAAAEEGEALLRRRDLVELEGAYVILGLAL